MKNLIIILIMCSSVLHAQEIDVDQILLEGREVPKVLLVGTFHFGYPGLDSHVTKDKWKIDILSESKQKELKNLLDYIALFKPTKIMIESGSNTGYLIERHKAWKAGKEKLRKSEDDQIGIRLMDRFGLDTLYGVDAQGLAYELSHSADSLKYQGLFDRIWAESDNGTNPIEKNYWKWYEKDDLLTYELPLLDYFHYQNSDKVIERMHGHYIMSDDSTDYDEMDGLILNWYSRHLRIFKNITMVDTNADDRILILFGAGHMGILKQQFEASPEYELIKFADLKKLD